MKKRKELYEYELIEKRADMFISHLKSATNDFLQTGNFSASGAVLSELKSFAIIDKFTDLKIVNVFNAVKIAILKVDFKAQKSGESSGTEVFKKELLQCYDIMEDLFDYEIFGFFSTTVHPHSFPEYKLPCEVLVACAPRGFEKEPDLDKDGNARIKKVVRFKNRTLPDKTNEWLCMTIEKFPQLLKKEKSKVALTGEQLRAIRNFIVINRKLIQEHMRGKCSSSEFLKKIKRF